MKYKFGAFSLLLFCSIFCFCGCSEINYGRIIYPNGEISDSITVSIEKEKIEGQGFDVSIFLSCIADEIDNQMNNLKVKSEFTAVYQPSTLDLNNGSVSAKIVYPNYASYCKTYGIDPDGIDEENEKIKGFLYDKEIFSSSNMIFSYAETIETIKNNIEARLRMYYPSGTNFSFLDVSCYYTYAMPLTQAKVQRIKSNADYSFDERYVEYSLRFFVWEYDHSNPDSQVMLYRNHIHYWVWYALGIAMTILFIIIFLLGHIIKKNAKNTKQVVISN